MLCFKKCTLHAKQTVTNYKLRRNTKNEAAIQSKNPHSVRRPFSENQTTDKFLWLKLHQSKKKKTRTMEKTEKKHFY